LGRKHGIMRYSRPPVNRHSKKPRLSYDSGIPSPAQTWCALPGSPWRRKKKSTSCGFLRNSRGAFGIFSVNTRTWPVRRQAPLSPTASSQTHRERIASCSRRLVCSDVAAGHPAVREATECLTDPAGPATRSLRL